MHNPAVALTYINVWPASGFLGASVCCCTFKVLFEEVRVGGVWHGAVRSRVAGVTHTVGPTHTRPVTITHVLTLWADVDVV